MTEFAFNNNRNPNISRLTQLNQRFQNVGGLSGIFGSMLGPNQPVITGDLEDIAAPNPRVTTGGSSTRISGDPRQQQDPGQQVTTGGGGRNSGGGSGRVTIGSGNDGGGGNYSRRGSPPPRGPRTGGMDFSRTNMLLGGALLAAPTVMQAGSDVLKGRTLDAAGTLAGAGGTLALTEGLGRTLQGSASPYAKAAGTALRVGGGIIAPMVGNILGNTLEKERARATGVAPAAASPVEQRIADRARLAQDADDQIGISQKQMDAYVAGMTDLYKNMSDLEYTNFQRDIPLLNQLKDREMVRKQALMNTQTSNYAMLGVVATAGKLATGAQAERGANIRTALTSNPYANSVIQAPNINFG